MSAQARFPLAGPPPDLLERDGDLDAIDRAIAGACAGNGMTLVVEGPPGAGKTALLNAARPRAAAAGMLVLHARAGELERDFAYGVARQLFEPHLLRAAAAERDALLDGAAGAAEAVLAPPAAAAEHPATATAARDAAFQTLHALYWLSANLTAAQPLVLAIDDLHWCDAGSLRWIAYLVRRIEALPLLLLVASRDRDPGAPAELLAPVLAEAELVLRPAPLGLRSVAQLAGDALGAPPDETFSSTCHRTTKGNPLLVRELLTALAGEGVRPVAAEAARVQEVGPQAITWLMRARLARLDPAPLALAQAAAVVGDGAHIADAGALAGLDEAAAAAAATTLSQAGLLRAEATLSFAHPLERAALYEAINPLEREAGHLHVARRLAERDAPAGQVAAHLLRAPSQRAAFAVATLREAATAALRVGAAETAVACLRRALGESLRTSERADVLFELGLAETLVDLAAAAEHLQSARALTGDGDERHAQIGLQLARALFLAGRAEEAVAAFEETIAGLDADRGELRSRLQADLLGAAMLGPGLYAAAERQLDAVATGAFEDGVGGRMLLAMSAYRDARRCRSRQACAERAERALSDGRLLDEEASSAFAYACRVLVVADRFTAAGAAYERALAGARARGSIAAFALGLAFRGGLAIHRGALADAESDGRAALDAARAGGVVTALPFSLTYLALALVEQGELDAATAMLDQFAREAGSFGDMPFFLLVTGRLRRAAGRAGAALDVTREAAAAYVATGQDNPALAAWRSEEALTRLELGDRDAARALAAEEVRLARAWGAPRTLGRALRVAGLAEGGERGLELLREALAVLARSPARLERAKTLVELGCAVRRGGRRSDARPILRRGLDLADACGARPLADRARGDLRAAGARPRRARLSGVRALTPSEQRVAHMAAEGMTNRGIAQALFVTTKTIEVHLSSAYRKLEIGSRTQLAHALARPADGSAGRAG